MNEIVLMFVLIISLVTDIYSRKILNIVTIPAIIVGFVYFTFQSGFEGVLFSVSGFLLGFIVLLIPFYIGGMGAGDVKLMAAIGALMGAAFVFKAFIFTALIGGIISLFLLLRRMSIMQVVTHMFVTFTVFRGNAKKMHATTEEKSNYSFPYGIAIVLGTFVAYIWGGFS